MTVECPRCGYYGSAGRTIPGNACPNCGAVIEGVTVPPPAGAEDEDTQPLDRRRLAGEELILDLLRAGQVPEDEVRRVDTGAVVANLLELSRGYEADPMAEVVTGAAEPPSAPGVTLSLEDAPVRPACARCLLPMPGTVNVIWREGQAALTADQLGRAVAIIAARLHTEGSLVEQIAALCRVAGASEAVVSARLVRQCAGCGGGGRTTTASARLVAPAEGDPPQQEGGTRGADSSGSGERPWDEANSTTQHSSG